MYMTTNGLKYHTSVSPSWDVCLYLGRSIFDNIYNLAYFISKL